MENGQENDEFSFSELEVLERDLGREASWRDNLRDLKKGLVWRFRSGSCQHISDRSFGDRALYLGVIFEIRFSGKS